MKKLFEINELLNDCVGDKIYIYGLDRNAWWLFMQCCSLKIFVEGFVNNECDVDMFFNKKVFKEDELEKKAVLLVPNKFKEKISYAGKKIFCDSIWDLKIADTEKKIVIYGAGVCGKNLLKCLRELQFDVLCFVETKVAEKKIIDGIPVQSIELLKELTEDTMVICTGKYCKEMYLTVKELIPDIESYCVTLGEVKIYCDRENIVFDRFEGRSKNCIEVISNMEEFFSDKTIWLYGGEFQMMCDDKEMYGLLGYTDIVIATDEEINGTVNIIDYLYEESAVIFLYDRSKVAKLESLGLKEGEDYVWGERPGPKRLIQTCYDINVGQAYKAYSRVDGECICPGIFQYGTQEKDDFIIMVLGGSTSEEVREWWKAWAYILYQKLSQDGKNVTIYNCANSGYTAAQELLHYLRDGAVIKPDLVISYSGANDVNTLYDAGFNLRALKYAGEFYTAHCGQEMTVGIEDKREAFTIWLDNIRCIHSLVQTRGSKYIAFAQPLFGAKKEYCTQHEKRLISKIYALHCEKDIEGCVIFREKMRNIHDDFIVDLTDIFDYEDVYYDICHVHERGNYIIASKIYEEITKRGILD